MTESKTKNRDRRRGIVRQSLGDAKPLDDWKSLEKLLGVALPAEARTKIDEANSAYAKYALLHSDENTLSYGKIKQRTQSWIKVTTKLLKDLQVSSAIKPHRMSRDQIMAQWREKRSRKQLKGMTPLEFFAFVLKCGVEAEAYALGEIENGHIAVAPDLWSAWVCIIGRVCSSCGVKPTAGGRIKGEGSPFVRAIEFLQDHLPPACRIYSGYESIRTNVQEAKRKLGNCSELLLWTVLTTWGDRIIRWQPKEGERLDSLEFSFNGRDWHKWT
jgi:hypothetical protein